MGRRKQEEVIEENISNVEYADVLKESYINYSMSVIIDRAVPDVRDGLKPVQRRILYDMEELSNHSDKPYRKSARIVGDTMGKYHPHGDSSIYEAAVVMSRDFKMGRKLIDGHGNFGSIEGDGAAAMRYTEVRLDPYTEETMLADLKLGTVDFAPNYDETEKEPVVLPAKLPNILINGTEGIAVGFSTSIPPHNIGEVIDATVAYLQNPNVSTESLMKKLPGPDFPTGGIIINQSELRDIYETGKGKVRVRAKITEEKGRGGRTNLVITEIPYTMVGNGFGKLTKSITALAESKKLTEVSDISNETSKDGIRVVIELKPGADVEYVKNVLYKKTGLEDTFGVQMLVICNNEPKMLGLKGLLEEFIDYQYEIYGKKYSFLLEKALKKKEIDEGLIKAIDVIDTIIEVLRGSKDKKQTQDCLINGNTNGIKFRTEKAKKEAATLKFTEAQTNAILDMRLERLIGLEIDALKRDYDKVVENINFYNLVLSSEEEMKNVIKKELLSFKKKYQRERRTEITEVAPIVFVEKEEEEAAVVVLMDKFGYIHTIDQATYEKNIDAVNETLSSGENRYVIATTNKSKLLVFTDTGKMHSIKVSDIPHGKLRDKGQPLDNISNYNIKEEQIVGVTSIKGGDADRELLFASSDGLLKKVNIAEFDVSRKTIDSTKLKGASKVVCVAEYHEKGQIVLITNEGYHLKFKQSDIPEKKKTAAGVIGINLTKGDALKECALTVEGFKIKKLEEIRLANRGGRGKRL